MAVGLGGPAWADLILPAGAAPTIISEYVAAGPGTWDYLYQFYDPVSTGPSFMMLDRARREIGLNRIG